MSWTVQKSNNNLFDPPHPGGFRGVAGGGRGLGVNISKVREMSWTAEKIDNLFLPTPHQRSGNFRGSKNQKSGKCHELPRKVITKINPTPPHRRLGVLWVKMSNVLRHFMNYRENRYFLLAPAPPPPTPSDGGVRGENVKVTKHQVLKSISGMQLSCAIITLQIFWAKPGNPREGG